MTAPDRIEPMKIERIRRLPLDGDDRRIVTLVLEVLVLVIIAAAALGLAVSAYTWTSGLIR